MKKRIIIIVITLLLGPKAYYGFCEEDINRDGVVDNLDFLDLILKFNQPCLGCAEDINGDGNVDNLDFLDLVLVFGSRCDEDDYIKDNNYNWSYAEGYDENGKIISSSVRYLDQLGRSTQSMSRNFDKNSTITTQTLYDSYGRAVINTLPAERVGDLTYQNDFITNVSGAEYSSTDFDTETTLNNPSAVGNGVSGSLGRYYSNNGRDARQSITSFPYSRVEYMADPTGRVKRSAAPGENFKMGSGHENQAFYMVTGGELDRAFGNNKSFYCRKTTGNLNSETLSLPNANIEAEKTISIDAEGKITINFTSDGLPIATCLSGETSTGVAEQSVSNTMPYEGTRSVDIHLPASKSNTLRLNLPTYVIGNVQPRIFSNQIDHVIMDLETNEVLQEGTDYSFIDLSKLYRLVSFTGSNKHRFLRISYDYTAAFKSIRSNRPNASVSYKLDYSHFSVNYYDAAGRLRKNVSPKGIDYSVNAEHTEFTKYDYSPLGNLIAQETPDEGLTEFLYSNEGVLRFSRNAQQRAESKFSYVRYDDDYRAIESGEYTETGLSGDFRFVDHYYNGLFAGTVKENIDIPDHKFLSNTADERYIVYDDILASADEIPAGYSFKNQYVQQNLDGRIAKTWNADHQTWYSYDYAGRPEFVVQELIDPDFSGSPDERVKTTDYTYSPLTSVLMEEEYQKNYPTEHVLNEYAYNDNYQLVNARAKDDHNKIIGEAAFEYNAMGQLKRKELGDKLQGLDYVYTLNGQLKSINHPSLSANSDPGKDGGFSPHGSYPSDLFGFTLDYYQNDYQRSGVGIESSVTTTNSGYYNGLIKASRWKIKDQNKISQQNDFDLYTSGDTESELIYKYDYDDLNRLEKATFGIFNNRTNSFAARNDFKVFGESASGGIDYDIIGNITSLNRNGYVANGGSTPPKLLMDDLDYTYQTGKSKLTTIHDAQSASGYGSDFTTSSSGDAFTYNNMGQMISSVADGVSNISYFPSGQVKTVVFANGDDVSYVYDEKGVKIKSLFTNRQAAPATVKTNWYVSDGSKLRSVYEKEGANSLAMTSQVIYCGDRLGINDVSADKMNYELTDHLGNVRVTFGDDVTIVPEVIYEESFDLVYEEDFTNGFCNDNYTNNPYPDDHEDCNGWAVYEPSNHFSIYNGELYWSDRQILKRSLSTEVGETYTFSFDLVSMGAGKSIRLNYRGLNDSLPGTKTATFTATSSSTIFTFLLNGPGPLRGSGALGGAVMDNFRLYKHHNWSAENTGITVETTGDRLKMSTNTNGLGVVYDLQKAGQSYQASLNVDIGTATELTLVAYNSNATVVSSQTISNSGTYSLDFIGSHIKLENATANGTSVQFYLDDVVITENVRQLEMTSWTDYYPFGEAMHGRSSNLTDNTLFGYQGQEKLGNGTKWYNFQLRMYNPSLGRFNTIDPYSQFHSPYLAMANNPISFVDPDGGRAECKICRAILDWLGIGVRDHTEVTGNSRLFGNGNGNGDYNGFGSSDNRGGFYPGELFDSNPRGGGGSSSSSSGSGSGSGSGSKGGGGSSTSRGTSSILRDERSKGKGPLISEEGIAELRAMGPAAIIASENREQRLRERELAEEAGREAQSRTLARQVERDAAEKITATAQSYSLDRYNEYKPTNTNDLLEIINTSEGDVSGSFDDGINTLTNATPGSGNQQNGGPSGPVHAQVGNNVDDKGKVGKKNAPKFDGMAVVRQNLAENVFSTVSGGLLTKFATGVSGVTMSVLTGFTLLMSQTISMEVAIHNHYQIYYTEKELRDMSKRNLEWQKFKEDNGGLGE